MAQQPAPKAIGSFEVERELGRGGMGVVYVARQPALGRTVVLKTLRRDVEDDERVDERFRREAQAAARVHHQNVVGVYDCFVWRGRTYIAQEFVDGVDLASALRLVRRLDPRIAALVALELARGLEEIHAQGIVHRDLKPSNALLGRNGEVKIADFGIALGSDKDPSLTQVGEAIGTPRYMSPEQLYGDRVDYRSDLYSLGVVLYESLAGKPAFDPTDPDKGEALLRRIEAGRYASLRSVAPDAPGWLRRLVRSCLRPKPKHRPASTTALRLALERGLGSPSPADARKEIAAWMWEREVFGTTGEKTVARPRKAKRAGGGGRVAALRWLTATGITAAAIAAGAWWAEHGDDPRAALYAQLGALGIEAPGSEAGETADSAEGESSP